MCQVNIATYFMSYRSNEKLKKLKRNNISSNNKFAKIDDNKSQFEFV